jgi:hypothetical protein
MVGHWSRQEVGAAGGWCTGGVEKQIGASRGPISKLLYAYSPFFYNNSVCPLRYFLCVIPSFSTETYIHVSKNKRMCSLKYTLFHYPIIRTVLYCVLRYYFMIHRVIQMAKADTLLSFAIIGLSLPQVWRCQTAFWDTAPCSLVEVDWSFWVAYCLHHQSDGMKLDFKKIIFLYMPSVITLQSLGGFQCN